MQPEKRNKVLLIAAVAFSVIVFVLWFFLAGPGRKVTVEIYVAPSDATITVDGQPVSGTKVTLKKGTHTFAAERQHFDPASREIDTGDLDETNTVYLALYPNSPEGAAFLQANPNEQSRYERIEGAEFSALQDRLLEDYPVSTKLPYQTLDYKIDLDITRDRQHVFFLVTFYPPNALTPGSDLYKDFLLGAKAEALEYLEREDVDIENADIRYTPDPDEQ